MNRFKVFLVLLFVFVLSSVMSYGFYSMPSHSGADKTILKVTRVVDGDTFVALNKETNKTIKVRMLGVDAPESVSTSTLNTSFGRKVSNYMKRKLEGKEVYIELDKNHYDAYGRTLAHVFSLNGKTHYNKLLLKKGYAWTYFMSPNVKYKRQFTAVQKVAQRKHLGIWENYYERTNPLNFKYTASKSSTTVHKLSCSFGARIKKSNRIFFKTLSLAYSLKYHNCRTCLNG